MTDIETNKLNGEGFEDEFSYSFSSLYWFTSGQFEAFLEYKGLESIANSNSILKNNVEILPLSNISTSSLLNNCRDRN